MSPFIRSSGLVVAVSMLSAAPAWADPFTFSTGNVTNLMAVASRPSSPGQTEREAADDFVTTAQTMITSATFTGLFVGLPGAGAPSIADVAVEMYRVFPNDSDTTRTPAVPTRVNSPSDVAFSSKDATAGELSFSTATLSASFTALNSVLNGINPKPNQTTGGDGAVTGTEVQFTVNFATPFLLPADHYFFVPQVQLTNGGQFYWLSATRPIVAPAGTPFAPDLQSWVRSDALDPDWLRIGTDIVGGATPPTYNQAFSLTGTVAAVPEPESWALMLAGLAGVSAFARRARRRTSAARSD